MAKKGTWEKIVQRIKEAMIEESIEEPEDLEEPEEFEVPEEPEEPEDNNVFITRMVLAYNHLVDASESMPISTSIEIKFKKDQERARVLYNRCIELANQYHNFLERMKEKVI